MPAPVAAFISTTWKIKQKTVAQMNAKACESISKLLWVLRFASICFHLDFLRPELGPAMGSSGTAALSFPEALVQWKATKMSFPNTHIIQTINKYIRYHDYA